MPSPTEITITQLARLIGTPDCPIILDVRIDDDFDAEPYLIPGSLRYNYQHVVDLTSYLSGKRVVVVCQKGHKLSHGVSAVLRNQGIAAETLQGGQIAWRDAGLPQLNAAKLPVPNKQGHTVWVTRHRPKVDRIACPWLIRRFVDHNAQFLFVPPTHVRDVAERFNATPFDVEDVFWSHRGEQCSFDTFVTELGLITAPLKHLATIIRGADTHQHDLAPEAAGLLAVSLGLSRMYRDDLAQLAAGIALYDALYRWCRDATNENHDCSSVVHRS